jgi:hypothetical protein
MNELTQVRQRRMMEFLRKKTNDPTRRMFRLFKTWKNSYTDLYVPQIGMTVGQYFVMRHFAKELINISSRKRKASQQHDANIHSPT